MLATKQSGAIPPVSVRLDGATYEQLTELNERYPLFSRSQMLAAALKYWMVDALKNGVDTNLQPLKARSKG